MGSKRWVIMTTLVIAAISLTACGEQQTEATYPTEPSPVPSVPTEPPTQEVREDEEVMAGPGASTLEAFQASLLYALSQTPPDYTTLQSCMGVEFWIFEPFAATNYAPAEAVAQFGANWLPVTSKITFDMAVDPHAKVTFPLPTNMDEYLYTTGWQDGSYLGVLLINSTPDGYEWVGVYLAPDEPQIAEPIRIQFEPGATGTTAWGSLTENGIDEYVLFAMEGQTMAVTITSPGDDAHLSIVGMSDGIPLVRAASDATSWKGVLPASQDYTIKVLTVVAVPSYQLDIFISPLEAGDTTLDWVTLPDGICQDLQVMVAGELGVTGIGLDTNAPFEDFLGGKSGEGCLISVSGTGVDFASPNEVFMQLTDMLVQNGWTPDPRYDADGPTGTSGGFRRNAALILVTVGWEPSADAGCPQDQPISACSLKPEQQIYTITLSAAMQ